MPLSVRVITKNEAQNIAHCLESVAWADEIVVVDAFSVDETLAISRQFTQRVYQREWDDYSSQKNYGDSLCTHDWILSLDADELVTPELREEIEAVTATPRFPAYRIHIRDFMFGKWIEYGSWPHQCPIRLYRRGRARWDAVVHEGLAVVGPTGVLSSPLLHLSHTSIGKFVRKMNLYTDLEAQREFSSGSRWSWARVTASSAKQFVDQYIRFGGFRDRSHGFVLAVLMAMYRFLLGAKLWALWYAREHNSDLCQGRE